MSLDVDGLLGELRARSGDPHAQAAMTARLLITTRPEPEREALRAALDAAAVLHWVDADQLRQMLGLAREDAERALERLRSLPFLERFQRPRGDAWNVHELTRLGWRQQLARTDGDRFRALSLRAAAIHAEDASPAGRIERIYHLVSGDPDAGVLALEELSHAWLVSARLEHQDALAAALSELERTRLVHGSARARVLLSSAWSRHRRGETANLGEAGNLALTTAVACGDRTAEGRARRLLGDVLVTQGKLEGARLEFERSLDILRELALSQPDSTSRQHDLALAYDRLGDVLEGQDPLAAAREAFGRALAIDLDLTEREPGNLAWQRESAVRYAKLGRIATAQGRLGDARDAFERDLEISLSLATDDPNNDNRQLDPAAAYSRVRDALVARGQLEKSVALGEEGLAIERRLVGRDASNGSRRRATIEPLRATIEPPSSLARTRPPLTPRAAESSALDELPVADPFAGFVAPPPSAFQRWLVVIVVVMAVVGLCSLAAIAFGFIGKTGW